MSKEQMILDQIKQLLAEQKVDKDQLRKSGYVKGYLACVASIERLIAFAQKMTAESEVIPDAE